MKRWNIVPLVLVLCGTTIVLLSVLLSGQAHGLAATGLFAGALLPLVGIPFLRTDASASDAALAKERLQFEEERRELTVARQEFAEKTAGIEQWRDAIQLQLDAQINRIESRERSLTERFALHQELFEYPQPSRPGITFEESDRLTQQDREVLEMLQKEAEVTYEKIRSDGYKTDGEVDVELIRDDVVQLVRRVARVYAPDSENPLLETSFEQVARAAGRVCLHALVLVEQLPLDVKQYSFNSLYAYVQRAVVAYGRYQKSAPWISYLSRSVYAGRFLAGTNPLTLGAWVVATEMGKRAGQRAVENFVDRQAVELLHDLIRVIGFEVANVYGGDFRHRDPNWIYGTELTELMRRFPLSRENLREGLQQVSSLPLRNEYDRIYLYRCIADHRSAGLALSDPALLTRGEREQIAQQLEKFFADFVHGATARDIQNWQESFEERFDMKLKLADPANRPAATDHATECVRSIAAFLQLVVGVDERDIEQRLVKSSLFCQMSATVKAETLGSLSESFQPPNLEPSNPAVDEYLRDLVKTVAANIQPDRDIERLLVETGAYFRRPVQQIQEDIDAAFVSRIASQFVEAAPEKKIPAALARAIITHSPTARVLFAYPDLSVGAGDESASIEEAWLVAFESNAATALIAFRPTEGPEPFWTAAKPVASRDKGFLIDDCRLQGGTWSAGEFPASAALVVAGTIRGGGYMRWFGPLLELCETTELDD